MNLIDFTKIGGYRLKQATLNKMQLAYFQILKAFITFCKVPDVGNYIISGCEIVGPDITPGIMFIDGELCGFAGSVGTLATKIKKLATITSLNFKSGTDENVFRETTAVVDGSGTLLSAFIRVAPVFDANYVSTENNFSDAWVTFLMTIEAGAEKNVQADWAITNSALDTFIKNKPVIENVLHTGEIWVGDFPNADTQRITVPIPNVGTVNYKVDLKNKSLSSLLNAGQDAIAYCSSKHEVNSFDIVGKEFFSLSQNIRFYYKIIAL